MYHNKFHLQGSFIFSISGGGAPPPFFL